MGIIVSSFRLDVNNSSPEYVRSVFIRRAIVIWIFATLSCISAIVTLADFHSAFLFLIELVGVVTSALCGLLLLMVSSTFNPQLALGALGSILIRAAVSIISAILLIVLHTHDGKGKPAFAWIHLVLAFLIPPFYVVLCYKGWKWCEQYQSGNGRAVTTPLAGNGAQPISTPPTTAYQTPYPQGAAQPGYYQQPQPGYAAQPATGVPAQPYPGTQPYSGQQYGTA
eukprot:TRINITY_DN68545_c0_g1_i1.p1 TRINITY_DN68545_c0_g1~~TRINITY_DN68545_c0_g1_i1.p1  ORF type:complete len:225 (+),score=8.34 TRINITY_DN68545_c0_g1_i1:25-699(+)